MDSACIMLALVMLNDASPKTDSIDGFNSSYCSVVEVNVIPNRLSQVIFWDTDGNVKDWMLCNEKSQIRIHKGYVTWFDKHSLCNRKVFCEKVIKTSTARDPELDNRSIHDFSSRIPLYNKPLDPCNLTQ